MNLPIGKLFYFIPKIQGYQDGASQNMIDNLAGGTHYAPVGAPGGPTSDEVGAGYTGAQAYKKNLYDLFYEGNEAALDPAGLFDYSKGAFSSVTATTAVVIWSNGELTTTGAAAAYSNTNVRKVLIEMSGFANTGAGKLIGPDGNEMDSEAFLSDLRIYANTTTPFTGNTSCSGVTHNGSTPNSLLFRVVTQQYGKGIVQYGSTTQTNFGNQNVTPPAGNGGSFNDICDADGKIYLEVDLSCPVCATCGGDTLDGYTGSTIGTLGADDFTAVFRRYNNPVSSTS